MFHVRPSGPRPCVSCSRPTDKPRRGMCFACYLRARRGATVDTCAACGSRDRRVLVVRTLADGEHALCANDAQILGKRRITLAALLAEVFPAGDRRQADRRAGDRRSHEERRTVLDVARLLDGDRREARGRRASDAA